MSEFKFSCPNCQQNIAATSEYSGLQINCPSCQTLLVVPTAPGALVPDPPKGGTRLSMSKTAEAPEPASSASAAAMMYGRQVVVKKKSKVGLIVGLSVTACVVAAAIIFGPTLMKKYKHQEQVDAAAVAATNTPPPPPPLTTEEILQNVAETYKGMTDYSAQATTVANLDMSALVPGKTAPVLINTTSSLQLGRTNNYRLEWEQTVSGTKIKGAAWSAGKGNFVGYGPVAPSKKKTREQALEPAESALLLSSGIVDIFYADTNSLAADAKSFTKTNASSLNGVDCYVLTGEENHLSLVVWVNKTTFLINQIELNLGGKMDPAELKKLPSAERNQMMTFLKLKGNVTETYDNIHTNQNLLATSFETTYQAPANAGGAQSERPGTMAGKLANPRRGRTQPQ